MFTCADCSVLSCGNSGHENMPSNCPMRDENFMRQAFLEYAIPENHRFFVASSEIEVIGYGNRPRLREIIELCKRLQYNKIGLAFCRGLRKEARVAPIVIASTDSIDPEYCITAYDTGADEIWEIPEHIEVAVAKGNAIIRRYLNLIKEIDNTSTLIINKHIILSEASCRMLTGRFLFLSD